MAIWTTPRDWTNGEVPDDTIMDAHIKANLTYLYDNMPARATLWHADAAVLAGGNITPNQNTSQRHGEYAYQFGAADADSFSGSVVLIAGTYSLRIVGIKLSSAGILDWTLDGASIATGQDWYAAGTTYNQEVTISGITVTGNGRHTLVGTVNGQNASSSGYDIYLTKYAFIPSAD